MTVHLQVILLDTRYHRDSHFIPSIGSFKIPFSALVAAFTRWLCGTLGLGLDHGGDILGEEQWLWLEDELKNSRAAAHILVSSIQVPDKLDQQHMISRRCDGRF